MSIERKWRDTALTPRFFFLDARAVLPLAIWLFHWRLWTCGLAIGGVALFWFLERRAMPFEVLMRVLRVSAIGRIRPVIDAAVWRRRCQW